jgi:hypothetical protein
MRTIVQYVPDFALLGFRQCDASHAVGAWAQINGALGVARANTAVGGSPETFLLLQNRS